MELNGLNENIFVDSDFVYINRNNKLYKYDKKHHLIRCHEVRPDKQIDDKYFCVEKDSVKSFDNLNGLIEGQCEKFYKGEDIVDFHIFNNNFFYLNSKNEVFKSEEAEPDELIVSLKASPYKFYDNFIFYVRNKNLIKLNLTNLEEEILKSNVKPTLIEVFEDLVVMTTGGIVQIISKELNLSFHKHSSTILGVVRIDNYLYFISKDKKLSVAEIYREHRKYLLEFIGDFKKMVVFGDRLYILTDIELIVFDLVKSKCQSFTFNLPVFEMINKIYEKKDEYFDIVTSIYKEKKVKTEVEPFYKVINENKYKVEEQVYAFVVPLAFKDTREYAITYKNCFFVYDIMSKVILKVFQIKGNRIYFSNGYLISLRSKAIDIYKYQDSKLKQLFRRPIVFQSPPSSIFFHNDTIYYQIEDKVFKTSIVLNRIEVLRNVKEMVEEIAVDDRGAFSLVRNVYVVEGRVNTVRSERIIVDFKRAVEKGQKEDFVLKEGKLLDKMGEVLLREMNGKKNLRVGDKENEIPKESKSIVSDSVVEIEGNILKEIK